MALLKAPLLSLGARKQFARQLTLYKRKTQHISREYTVPANPRTAKQTAHRDAWSKAIWGFRNMIRSGRSESPEAYAGWTLYHRLLNVRLSPYNVIVSAIIHAIDGGIPRPSFLLGLRAVSVFFYALAVDVTTAAGREEDGDGTFRHGLTPRALTGSFTRPMKTMNFSNGTNRNIIGVPIGTSYFQLEKDGVKRSGIHSITFLE